MANDCERIDKILSHHGFGSRKDVKKLMRGGFVVVNGKAAFDPGMQIRIGSDTVLVDGVEIKLQRDVYIMMNKCRDVVCANRDGEHRTVFDLLDDSVRHKFLGGDLHCMGRLDIDTEGLLIITTDGALTHRLLAPKTHVPKTYAVALRDSLDESGKAAYVEKFARGFFVDREGNEDGFDALPAELEFADFEMENSSEKADCLLTIYEGKFHQVKRMFAQLGNEVVYLKRVAMGALKLDASIPLGAYRELSEREVSVLRGDDSD